MYPDSKKAPANLEHHLLLVLWGHAGLRVAARVHQPVHVQVRRQGSGNQVEGGRGVEAASLQIPHQNVFHHRIKYYGNIKAMIGRGGKINNILAITFFEI